MVSLNRESREFIRHCRHHNLYEVKKCLQRGVNVDTVTAGLIASIAGLSEGNNKKCVELLAKTGKVNWTKGDSLGQKRCEVCGDPRCSGRFQPLEC